MMNNDMTTSTRKKVNKEWGIEEERYARTAPGFTKRKLRKRDTLPIIFVLAMLVVLAIGGWRSSAKADGTPTLSIEIPAYVTGTTGEPATAIYGSPAPNIKTRAIIEHPLTENVEYSSIAYTWYAYDAVGQTRDDAVEVSSILDLNNCSTVPVSTDVLSDKYYYCVATVTQTVSAEGEDPVVTNLDPVETAPIRVTVSPKPVTISNIVINKTYDGTTSATIPTKTITGVEGSVLDVTINGVISYDANDVYVSPGVTVSYPDKNAEENKNLIVSGTFALNGAKASCYELTTQPAVTGTISPKGLTISSGIVAADKVYDKTTSAVLSLSDNSTLTDQLETGDTVTLSGTGTFASANASASPQTVSFTSGDLVLGGADAANYVIETLGQTETTATISRKEVTVSGITGVDKAFDDNTSASLNCDNAVFTGKLAGDTLIVSATGTFADKNIGEDKTVNISGITLSGASADNYVLASSGHQTTTTATIYSSVSPTVTITGEYTYQGSAITPSYTVKVGDTTLHAGTDYTALLSDNINAGDNTGTLVIKAVSGSLYRFDDKTVHFSIAKAPVTAASVNLAASTLTYNGSEQTKTVTSVSVYGVALDSGKWSIVNNSNKATDAGDHTITIDISGDPNVEDGSVTKEFSVAPKEVTVPSGIVAIPKTYDGNSSIDVDASSATIEGNVDGANLSAIATGHLRTYSAGTNDVVIDSIVLDGAKKDNYVLASSGNQTTTTVDIAPKALTPTVTVTTATYNGSAQEPAISVRDGSILLTTDDYTVSYSNNTNAGNASDENPPVVVVTRKNGSNYTFAQISQPFTINKKTVTISGITAQDKDYDRTDEATLVYTGVVFDGKETGDILTLTASGRFSNYNAGSRTVSITNPVLAGRDADNYVLASSDNQATASATIRPIEVTVPSGIVARNKPYDGNTTATLICTSAVISGIINPDDVGVSATGTFDSADIGSRTVTISGLTLTGNDKGNYVLASSGNQSTTTASITDTVLTPTITVASGSVYTGSAITPAVTVKVGTSTLVKDTDYTLSYSNNINAGTTARVTVTRKAGSSYNFSETSTEYFTINKCPVTVSGISTVGSVTYDTDLSASDALVTTGVQFKHAETGVVINDSNLRIASVTASFTNKNVNTNNTADNITISGITLSDSSKDNYSVTSYPGSCRVLITPKDITSQLAVSTGGPYTYTGKTIKPTVTVTYSGTTISSSTYTNSLSSETVKDAGSYPFTIQSNGTGNYTFTYSGTVSVGKSTAVPKAPKSTMTISSITTDPDSLLKSNTGWEWTTTPDFSKLKKAGESVTATARYTGTGEESYEDSAKSVSVTITLKSDVKDTSGGSTKKTTGSGTGTTGSGSRTGTSSSKTSTSTGTSSRTGSTSSRTSSSSSSSGSTSSRTGSSARNSSGSASGTGSNTTATEAKPPFVEGAPDLSGWETIAEKLLATAIGDSLPVYMNGSSLVPSSLLNGLKGRNVTLVLDMGNSIKWNINGACISQDLNDDLDFAITTNTRNIPTELVDMVSAGDYKMQLHLDHNGDFMVAPILTLNLGANNAGLYANLFYFNESANALEYVTADEISEDGTASLTFTHASDYVIIVDKEILANVAVHLDKPAVETTTIDDSAEKTTDNNLISNIADPNSTQAFVQSQPMEENKTPKSAAVARRIVSPEAKSGLRVFWILLILIAVLVGVNTFLFMNRDELKASASSRASKKALAKSSSRAAAVNGQKNLKKVQKANNKKFKKYL